MCIGDDGGVLGVYEIQGRPLSLITSTWCHEPGVVCVLVMMKGFEVGMRSRAAPSP